ncbi:MAG: hypothetical protein R2851_03625 [Caldilineaceae bacterium]
MRPRCALLSIVFLPHAAFLALDAIVRTLRRVYVTHRHLLEWTTSAQTARLMRRRSRSFAPWMQTIEAPIFALVVGGALIWWAPQVLPVGAAVSGRMARGARGRRAHQPHDRSSTPGVDR